MLNVVCLKHGTKYSSDYVNRLHNMVKRHLTVPFNFACFTDNSNGIDTSIEIVKLPDDKRFQGWWWKPYLFKPEHYQIGDTNLFFDLDMVIVSNIDKLVNYMPGEFLGLKDVGRVFNPKFQKLGSAVLRWTAGEYSDIWSKIESNPNEMKRYQGDQDWIWSQHKDNIKFFPDSWIRSYKWEIRKRDELIRINGRYNFKDIQHPKIDPETCVLAFHGSPDPHEVSDPIIVDNWC
jgi:hypothetical protein